MKTGGISGSPRWAPSVAPRACAAPSSAQAVETREPGAALRVEAPRSPVGLAERALHALRRHRGPVAAVVLGASLVGCAGGPVDAGWPTPEPLGPSVEAPAIGLPARALDNADRVARAEAKLAAAPEVEARLPASVRAALLEGVRAPRHPTHAPEGVVSPASAMRAATATAALSAADLGRLEGLLDRAGADVERALLLEALGARGPARLDEVAAFADEIRGRPRAELLRTTTGLDVDPHNTSPRAPTDLLRPIDRAGDNDGLYQRWVDACGPTTAQLLVSELDPIYARGLHASLGALEPEAGGGAEQARVLDRAGAPTAARLARQTLAAIAPSLSGPSSPLTEAEQDTLRDWIAGRTLDAAQRATLDRAVATLRARHGDPSEVALRALFGDDDASGAGMILVAAFDAVAGELGLRFREVEVPEGRLSAHLDGLAERLADGEDIPIRAGSRTPVGHALLLTDARGAGDDRWFQVADPWTGRTAWASQADLLDGSFLGEVVGLGHLTRITHYYLGEPR